MEIRRATPADGPGFLDLVHSLAAYQDLPSPTPEACARLRSDAFAEVPKFHLLVAVDNSQGAKVVAHAAWFLAYSTTRAKATLHLEDLFVAASARRQGLATRMMRHLKKEAEELGCGLRTG